jgi:hypothetical protein
VVSGATLGVEMVVASAGAFPSSVLGLVAQAPMVAPGCCGGCGDGGRGLLDSGSGGEEVLNVEVLW